MNQRHCDTEATSPGAAQRMIVMSLLFAAGILLSAWLGSTGAGPGVGVAVIAVAGLLGGWLLNSVAHVRGLPLALAAIGTTVTLVGWAMGWQGATPPGITTFMALLLTVNSRSWKAGLAVGGILAGSEILTWLI